MARYTHHQLELFVVQVGVMPLPARGHAHDCASLTWWHALQDLPLLYEPLLDQLQGYSTDDG